MRNLILSATVLALGATGIAACSSYYGDGYYAGGNYPSRYYGGYGYYDGYYDDFYGPVSYGYWGPDNYFYYSTTFSGPYIRDDARHFRRDRAEGWRQFHMRGQLRAETRRDRDWKG